MCATIKIALPYLSLVKDSNGKMRHSRHLTASISCTQKKDKAR